MILPSPSGIIRYCYIIADYETNVKQKGKSRFKDLILYEPKTLQFQFIIGSK
jgi:hypothetical protein